MNSIRGQWLNRQQEYGNSPRAVLMKGAPALLNALIDRWHKAVLRHVFRDERHANQACLDLGCGYGRLAAEATARDLSPVVGMDFTLQFCIEYAAQYGPAVCGKLTALPFTGEAFQTAYSVTALMYLSLDDARAAMQEIDRCSRPGARILILEPACEFNTLVHFFARKKRNETLAQPGLSRRAMEHGLVPPGWTKTDSGGCTWMTWMLPLLMLCARSPRLFEGMARLVLRLDSPRVPRRRQAPKIVMYRWIAFDKQPQVASQRE